MSAVPRQPGDSYAGLRLTADQYLALGETDERYELIDGAVQMSPAPSRRHQRVLGLLMRQLEQFVDSHPGHDFYPDISVRFGPHHVLEPDLACFVPGRLPPDDKPVDVAPDLVIEILSPSNRDHDLKKKRSLYERFGVREYWVVDPESAQVRSFRLVTGDRLESHGLPGCVLDLERLRDA